MPIRSQPAPPPLTEAVRTLYRERKSGVLEVSADGAGPEDPEGGKRRLFFVRGELHLPSIHALAKKLAPHLPLWPDRPSRSGASAGASATASVLSGAKGEVKELMGRIARLISGWDRAAYTFFEGPQTLPPDLVGPLPTVFLLMEWAIAGRSDVELLAELGGPAAQLVSAGGALSPSVAAVLEPPETVLLARLGEPVTVGEVLRQSGAGGATLRHICRLRAVGLVRIRSEAVSEPRAALVPADVLRQFSERIEGGLAELPFDLDLEEHRRWIADLLVRGGGLSHFELLGISTEAGDQEVYDAYERIARLVHPSHAERLRMTGREAALWLLFERATDAYLTLSSPDRRRAYETKLGLGHDPHPSDEARRKESEKLARGYYQRALDYIDQQEFHFAVELLRQAIQADPLAEYYLRLGEVQAKNPNWARQAADSYKKAIELGADEAWVRVAVGQLCESQEHYDEARRHYEVALSKMPGEPEALAGLARISALAAPVPKRRGWLKFLRRDGAG